MRFHLRIINDLYIRDMPLRRGLNVIWSPDPGSAAANVGQNSYSGHSAGKNLLCRLLRYRLGEASLRTKSNEEVSPRSFLADWLARRLLLLNCVTGYLQRRTDELRDQLLGRTELNPSTVLVGSLDLVALQAVAGERLGAAAQIASLRPFADQISKANLDMDAVLRKSAIAQQQLTKSRAHLNAPTKDPDNSSA